MKLIDTHTHLHFENYQADLDTVINRSISAGVDRLVTIGTDIKSSLATVELANHYPGVLFGAVGLHPTDCANATEEEFNTIRELAVKNKHIVAIGEIGLDLYWKDVPLDIQLNVFEAMHHLSNSLSKPMIIHNRDALAEMRNYFSFHPVKNSLPGVMHSFAGNIEDAKFFLDLGFYISFTGTVTFKNFKNSEVVRYIPLDRLLLETDSPFLAPYPYRGKRNEPSYLIYALNMISKIKSIASEELAEITTENSTRLFGFSE